MPLRERGKTGEEEEEEGFEQWDAFRRRGCQRWQGGGKISILLANNAMALLNSRNIWSPS